MKRELKIAVDGRELTVTADRTGDEIVVEHDGQSYTVTLLEDTVVGAPAAATPTPSTPTPSTPAAAVSAPPPGRPAPASSTTTTRASSGGKSAAGDVACPMTGVVDQVLVREGQAVGEGDRIVILEAMKMYIDVVAPSAGTVGSIHVSVGDAVKEGQALLRIE